MSPYLKTKFRTHRRPVSDRRRGKIWSKNGLEVLNILLLTVLLVLGFSYLIQINKSATAGFQIRDLEQKTESLRSDNQKLELEVAALQSRDIIKNKINALGMVSVEKIRYVTPKNTEMAKK